MKERQYIEGNNAQEGKYFLPYNLQFFAGEKTEDATSKKLKDARSEGQVAKSTELITATALATLFYSLRFFMGYIGKNLLESFYSSYGNIEKYANEEFTVGAASAVLKSALSTIIWICFPIFITGVIASFVVVYVQVKWKVSGKLIMPKFSKINPVSGFKRIFSKEKLFEVFLSIVKIGIITYISYDTLKDEWPTLLNLYDINLEQAVAMIGNIIIDLGIKISILFIFIGFADYIFQKFKFKKDMKMSKQEVKDEYKQSEGDPQVKGKIRAKMREVSQRRMMQALPKADVVITNPTHFACAIKYDKETSEAPILLAKGADYLAQKIKDVAKENQIIIVENKPLARMLYYNVEVGAEIPQELYQMTAEVLAYVYGLKNK
ncbi:MAG: hypothetical protein K0S47_1969 [Herbinix sp.]|jgi:flagellar biosynthetic protein FlhB|nr:hypothetical protein [Herbinix sp.]